MRDLKVWGVVATMVFVLVFLGLPIGVLLTPVLWLGIMGVGISLVFGSGQHVRKLIAVVASLVVLILGCTWIRLLALQGLYQLKQNLSSLQLIRGGVETDLAALLALGVVLVIGLVLGTVVAALVILAWAKLRVNLPQPTPQARPTFQVRAQVVEPLAAPGAQRGQAHPGGQNDEFDLLGGAERGPW